MKKVLILSSADTESGKNINKNFVSKLNKQFGNDFQASICHYNDVGLFIKPGAIKAVVLPTSQEIKDTFNFVFFKSYHRDSEVAVAIADYLQLTGVPFLCSELGSSTSFSKLSQLTILARHSMPIIQTIYLPRKYLVSSFSELVEKLGLPFIMKAIDGKLGRDNYLIKTEAEFHKAVDKSPETEFVEQIFIPNKYDLRILVLDNQIKLVVKRQRKDNTSHLNNTSQGADAFEVPIEKLPETTKQLVLKCAALMKREIAGVDILFESSTNKPFVLEINASPQAASGAFPEKKIKLYGEMFQGILKSKLKT